MGPNNKSHAVCGIGNHSHMRFDPKLVHGTCLVCLIPCACPPCTSMIGQPWYPGMSAHKQLRYQPVKYCTYWTVLGSFNNWDIIQLSHKETSSQEIDKINQAVLDGVRDNMASLEKYGKYGSINTTDTTSCG